MAIRPFLATSLVVLSLAHATGSAPLVLPHEGWLVDGDNLPVSGTVPMSFALYRQATPAGGEERWWPATPVEVPVQVANGRYSLLLGSVESGTGAIDAAIFDATGERWLQISVNGTPLLPRLRVASVPYALVANRAAVADQLGACEGCVTLEHLDREPDGKFTGLDADKLDGADSSAFLRADGSVALSGPLLLAEGAPVDGLQATSKDYVDGAVASAVRLSPGQPQAGGVSVIGDVSAAKFIGDGSLLSGISGSAIVGELSDAVLPSSIPRLASGNLAIAGTMQLGGGAVDCTEANAGAIRWDGSHFQGCNGAAWRQFDNAPPPDITVLEPASGNTLGGYEVTINGSGFFSPVVVLIGGVEANVIEVTASTVAVLAPPSDSIGPKDVKLTNADGQFRVASGAFTYGYPPPHIVSVTPATAFVSGGQQFTITGEYFLPPVTVSIGGNGASIVGTPTSNEVTVTVPAGEASGPVNVTITNDDGQFDVAVDALSYVTPGASQAEALASCSAIKTAWSGAPTGTHWIDPTGGATTDSFQAHCDMTTAGGGWTLVAKVTDDFDWVTTANYGNLFHASQQASSVSHAVESGAASGRHLPNPTIRSLFANGSKQVRFTFYDTWPTVSDDAYATFNNAYSLFVDSAVEYPYLKNSHYTFQIIQQNKASKGFSGAEICWSNRNGQAYRGYEHGFFMGKRHPTSPCHLENDVNEIQVKSHYAGGDGTTWYPSGVANQGHALVTYVPLQVAYNYITFWVR